MGALLAAAAPLFDAPVTASSDFFGAFCFGLFGGLLIVVGLAMSESERDRGVSGHTLPAVLHGLPAFPALIIGPLLIVGMLISGSTELAASIDANKKAHAAHTKEVASWLDNEYGIDASVSALDRLGEGEPVAVSYRGQQTLIEFKPDSDDRIAVFDAGTGTALSAVQPR